MDSYRTVEGTIKQLKNVLEILEDEFPRYEPDAIWGGKESWISIS